MFGANASRYEGEMLREGTRANSESGTSFSHSPTDSEKCIGNYAQLAETTTSVDPAISSQNLY